MNATVRSIPVVAGSRGGGFRGDYLEGLCTKYTEGNISNFKSELAMCGMRSINSLGDGNICARSVQGQPKVSQKPFEISRTRLFVPFPSFDDTVQCCR